MANIIIGQITRPQGIKGEIKVYPLTQNINRFLQLKEIYLGEEKQTRAVRGCRLAGNNVLMFIDGILTRNDAESVRGLLISVDKEDAISLEDGEYFVSDIIGCKIYSDDGIYIGIVTDIINNGAADVYQVDSNGKNIMFPFIKRLNAQVDVNKKTITLNGKAFWEVACSED